MSKIELIRDYWISDSGVVSVDYVVLSGAIVGMGLGVIGVVSSGVSHLSMEIGSHMSSMRVPGILFAMQEFYDFDDGFDDWTVLVNAHEDPVLTGMLGPFFDQSGNPVVLNTFEFQDGTEFAVIEFDLMAVGRWEAHDHMRLFANGQMIDATRLRNENIQSIFSDDSDDTEIAYQFIERRTYGSEVIEERIDIANSSLENGATTTHDAIRSNVNQEAEYTVQVVVRNPGSELEFGIGRSGNSPYPGEAWAVENFLVESANTDPNAD